MRDDAFNTIASPFNIIGTPTTIILDKDGGEVERFIGYDDNHYNQIKDEIELVFGKSKGDQSLLTDYA